MFHTPLFRLLGSTAMLFTASKAPRDRPIFASTNSTAAAPVAVFPRLHGTVTGYKHRRGYGFILAEGVVGEEPAATAGGDAASSPPVDVSKLMTSYFFTRNALMGGFYITEGERVSFDVEERQSKGRLPKPGFEARQKPKFVAIEAEEHAPTAAAAAAPAAADGNEGGVLNLAVRVQMLDLKTGCESPVEPIALRGKIVRWDAARGLGVIGELDTEGDYHADAPKFFVCLDDCDLIPGMELRSGRYVRFCVEKEDTAAAATSADVESSSLLSSRAEMNSSGLPVARRVAVDRSMENRLAVVGRPLAPAGAARGTVTACTRFYGTVRDMTAVFGFVQDELSGESIFFHISNARSKGLQAGDHVSYLLRELTHGRHTGKKASFDVRRERKPAAGSGGDGGRAAAAGAVAGAAAAGGGGGGGLFDIDEEEYEMDVEHDGDSDMGESHASSARSSPSTSAGGARGRKRRSAPVDEEDDDFDLLD